MTLDFNRAQNPPCAYNPWTTCPLPPSANKLPVRIEAGEKRYHAEATSNAAVQEITRGSERDGDRFELPRVFPLHVRSRRHARFDDAVVVRNTLEGGRRAGYLTALGAALANTIIAISCGLGLSVLLSVWPGSLEAIRIGGALFLSWLGVSSLYRAAMREEGGIRLSLDPGAAPARSHAGAYVGDGLGINLLSPVIISFYLSVVPAFIPAAHHACITRASPPRTSASRSRVTRCGRRRSMRCAAGSWRRGRVACCRPQRASR